MVPLLTSKPPFSSNVCPFRLTVPPGDAAEPTYVRLPPPRTRVLVELDKVPPGLIVITPSLDQNWVVKKALTIRLPLLVLAPPAQVEEAALLAVILPPLKTLVSNV